MTNMSVKLIYQIVQGSGDETGGMPFNNSAVHTWRQSDDHLKPL